jgi:transcriptional regulator with XRE-family HTH domain
MLPEHPTLAQILRQARLARGLTRRQAAAQIALPGGATLSPKALRNYERGWRRPALAVLRILAQFYQLDFAELALQYYDPLVLLTFFFEKNPTLRDSLLHLLRILFFNTL